MIRLPADLVAELAITMYEEYGMKLSQAEAEDLADALVTVFSVLASAREPKT